MASRSDLGHLFRLRRLRKLSAFAASDKTVRHALDFVLPRFTPAVAGKDARIRFRLTFVLVRS
jgi:hypothetical protein